MAVVRRTTRVDQAVPVADEAFLGQRLFDHGGWTRRRCAILPHSQQGAQQRQGQQQAKAQAEAFSNGDLIHEEGLIEVRGRDYPTPRGAA